jgi:hypothetical protein
MRFLFSTTYWRTDEDGYLGKAAYEEYGAVIRRFKNVNGLSDKAWFIDFNTAPDIVNWMKKYSRGGTIGFDSTEQFPVFNPFHECE